MTTMMDDSLHPTNEPEDAGETSNEWQPIETAPRFDMARYIGFDKETADLHNDPQAGVCLITWLEADEEDVAEGYVSEWQVQPFSEGMDCIGSETNITHWMPLPSPPKVSG